jgi:hypothetical protein
MSDNGVLEGGITQIGASQVRVGEVSTGQIRVSERGVTEIDLVQISFSQVAAGQVCVREIARLRVVRVAQGQILSMAADDHLGILPMSRRRTCRATRWKKRVGEAISGSAYASRGTPSLMERSSSSVQIVGCRSIPSVSLMAVAAFSGSPGASTPVVS